MRKIALSIALCRTGTFGCRHRVVARAASAACTSKSGLPVDDSGPVPEQTNTRKSWPKTSRRPPVSSEGSFALLPAKSRPEVQEPGGFLWVAEGDPKRARANWGFFHT